jgi:tetratricopeptide (TPR) repeat protein
MPFSFSQIAQKDSINDVLSSIKIDSLLRNEYYKIYLEYKNSQPELHYYYSLQALKKSKITKDVILKREALANLGIYYRKKGQLDSAIYYYNKVIKICEKHQDSVGLNNVKSALGNALKAKGDFPNAIRNFTEAITFFEKSKKKNVVKILKSKVNLGGLYIIMKDWEKADKYLEEVFNHPFTKKNKRLLGGVSINLVAVKSKLNLLDDALKYAKIAEKIVKKSRSQANLFNNIGNIYIKKKNYELAYEYYKKSLEKNEKMGDSNAIQKNYNNIGNAYLLWKKFDKAEHYLLKSNALLEKSDNINSLLENTKMLSDLYAQKNDYKTSLMYIKETIKINDSILGKEKQNAIANYETKYKTETSKRKKELAEKQLIISELERKKDRNILIGTLLIGSLLLISLLFYFGRFKAKKQAELTLVELKDTQKRLALEKQYRDSELKALKSQMNPHFIFNVLNSIQEYIILNKKDLAGDYLGKFSDLIRTYLHHSDKGSISIQEEIDSLKTYLDLECLRFEDKLQCDFKVEKDINADVLYIPTMLIQPYIENALKHGLLHKKTGRKLNITFSKSDNKNIECVIEDNGVGRKKSKEYLEKRSKLHKSFAAKATKERLDLLNFGKDKKIGVEIIDLVNDENIGIGTKVILHIPTTNPNK